MDDVLDDRDDNTADLVNNTVDQNDAPDFIKKMNTNSVGLNVNFNPVNHFAINVPTTSASDLSFAEPDFSAAPKERPSFLESAEAQFEHMSTSFQLLHAAYQYSQEPWLTPRDPNFDPLQYQDKFLNVQPQYLSYLLNSENQQDMDYRLSRIYREQQHAYNIANGSWAAYLIGGAAGMVTDLTNFIPIVGWAKYAKFAKTFVSSAARSIPGAATYAGVSAFGEQIDSINGNFQDGIIDAATKTLFGSILFGGLGVAALSIDKAAIWESRSWMNDYIKGVGIRLKADTKGKVVGAEAYDTTNGNLSAATVKLAQDKLDSTFSKTGIFKIPYFGDAAIKFLGNKVFGSTIVSMLNSPYPTLRQIGDLAYDHGIITTGVEAGKPNPTKFFTLLKQTSASIRAQEAQINALHLERNGFSIDNYVAQSAVKAGLLTRQKTMDILGREIGDRPYISRETFFNEIETVLRNEETSAHGSVNEAAAMYRKTMDDSYRRFRQAYGLSEDWLPPKTAQGYLMRVYDTHYLNNNENQWIDVVSKWLKDSDDLIVKKMEPINRVQKLIDLHVAKKSNPKEIRALRTMKKVLNERLQNEIRENPDLHLLAEDWNHFTADEAKELKGITKARDSAQKKVDELKKANPVEGEENARLAEAEKLLEKEEDKLQELAESKAINSRYYYKPKDSNVFVFKDPGQRIKLRRTYHEQKGFTATEEEAHAFRREHAKAYYNTIMNQRPEDVIAQVMSKFTGNTAENPIKERTLLIPDEILYDNNFMTKDLQAKVNNYVMWFDRRTHLKNTFSDATLDGGFEPLFENLANEYEQARLPLNKRKESITSKLENKDLSAAEKKKLEADLKKVDLDLNKETNRFSKAKSTATFAYEKMVGISRLEKKGRMLESSIRSSIVSANLGFLPATQIGDLAANALQNGLIPLIRDGIYPMIQSLGGYLKTMDSEAFRKSAAAINLGFQHVGAANAEKNIGMQTNPYLNVGKIPAALDKLAQFSSNTSFANLFDNYLQQVTASTSQAVLMRIMHDFKAGKASKSDILWANKMGVNPEKWSDRFVAAYKKDGGSKTFFGGYQSNFYQWEDLEASNAFGDAIFRAVHNTVINANVLDTPIWMDSNGPLSLLGPIIKGFRGWSWGSLNRYVIPSLQRPEASQLIGLTTMLAAGAMISPTRRLARGEDPYPKNMTPSEWGYEVLSDSGYFSYFTSILNDANLVSGGTLLRDMKNDKYANRSRAGLLGPFAADLNNIGDIVGAAASNEMNEHDMLMMARMLPPFNTLALNGLSNAVIKSMKLPKNRSIAHRQKNA